MKALGYASVLCLFVLCGYQPVEAESPTDTVYRLRQEATTSRTKSEADQKLNQAEDVLKNSRRSMSSLDHDFLQNEITQTRGLVCISFWQRNQSDIRLRDEGRRWLLTALDKYRWLAKRCRDRAEATGRKLNASQIAQDKSYQTTVGNISRAKYKRAWTEYLLGICTDRLDERQKHLKNGLDGFVSFTTRGYRNDPIVADCFVGHARCLYELGRFYDAADVLDTEKITQDNTTPDNYKRITKLRIEAYEALARHLMVDDSARNYFESFPNDHLLDSTELAIAVSWARSLAFLISDPVFDKYAATYEKHLETICKRISPYGESWHIKLAQALRDSGMENPLKYVARPFPQAASGKLESRLMAVHAEANLLAGNTERVDKHIDALLNAESIDPHGVTALINVANQLEQARADIGEQKSEANRIDLKLVRVYVSLLDRIGKNEGQAIRDKESVVRLNLAKCFLRLHRHKEAIDHYREYLRDIPAEKAYVAVRDLALAYEQIDQYESALGQWRKLYSGTKRRTNEWIEAAYHIIHCHLIAGDRDHATKVLAHFKILCPPSNLGEWDRKFEAIERALLKTEVSVSPSL